MNNLKLASFIMFSCLLVSCGGGGGSSSSSLAFEEVDARALYSGLNSQATLTEENGLEFIEAVFNSYLNDLGGSTNLSAKPINSNNNQAQARAVNDTIICNAGGTIGISGDLNEDTLLGVLNLDLNQCDDGTSILTGLIDMKVDGFNIEYGILTSSIMSTNNLMLYFQNETHSLSGTETYDFDGEIETIVSNTISLDPDGKQTLTEDFIRQETYGVGSEIFGKIYLEDYGYVQITTPEVIGSIHDSLPTEGEISLTGLNNSKILLIPTEADGLRVILDSDGDDIYESYTYITDLSSLPSEFQDNLPPVLTIEPIIDDLIDSNSSDTFIEIALVDLSDGNIYFEFYIEDPENFETILNVSLVSQPVGSVAILNEILNTNSPPDSIYIGDNDIDTDFFLSIYPESLAGIYYITPNVVGSYVLEVLATDAGGVTTRNTYSVHISM